MTLKLIWKEETQPTGPDQSLQQRAWPTGYFSSGEQAVHLICKDSYDPAIAEAGMHSPLTVIIAVYSATADMLTWRTLKQPADTLEQAKSQAMDVFTRHPEYFPRSLKGHSRRAEDRRKVK